jgi:hypothetical protein
MWLNASVDENTTIDLIVNAMTSTKAMLHILQQGCSEGTPSFETPNQAIMNISKDIDVTTKKSQTQKWKEPEAKPEKMKVIVKATRNKVVKKRTPIVESSSSSDSEVSLPSLKEELYIVLEATPKNDQRLVHFAKAKWQVLNSTKSFSISIFFFFEYIF